MIDGFPAPGMARWNGEVRNVRVCSRSRECLKMTLDAMVGRGKRAASERVVLNASRVASLCASDTNLHEHDTR